MDDLYVVSRIKYICVCVMSVILPIVAVIVMLFFGVLTGVLDNDYVPKTGIWYCEELGLEANMDDDQRIMTTADGEVLYIHIIHNRVHMYRIFDVEKDSLNNGENYEDYENYEEETVYLFDGVKLKKDRWIVCDSAGKEYVFVRRQVK